MSKTIIHRACMLGKTAEVTVYYDSMLEEYTCVVRYAGKVYRELDYYTDGRKDAIDTARAMLRNLDTDTLGDDA